MSLWAGYRDGIERVFGSETKHVKSTPNEFLKGWVIHYKHFRPHLSLNDRTPAQVAGIKFPCANWKELIEKQP
jgi:hypothetical protein